MGLVVHGMQGFDFAKAHSALKVPDDYAVAAMFAAGRPTEPDTLPQPMREREKPSDRKPVAQIICEGAFAFGLSAAAKAGFGRVFPIIPAIPGRSVARKSLGLCKPPNYAKRWKFAPAIRNIDIPVATMKRNIWFSAFGLMAIVLGIAAQLCSAKAQEANTKPGTAPATATPGSSVEFFDAMEAGQINAKFIALNDHEAKLIVTNNTPQPVNLKLP